MVAKTVVTEAADWLRLTNSCVLWGRMEENNSFVMSEINSSLIIHGNGSRSVHLIQSEAAKGDQNTQPCETHTHIRVSILPGVANKSFSELGNYRCLTWMSVQSTRTCVIRVYLATRWLRCIVKMVDFHVCVCVLACVRTHYGRYSSRSLFELFEVQWFLQCSWDHSIVGII